MRRGSALIVLAGILSCTGRPDAPPANEAGAPPAADSQPAEAQPAEAPPASGADLAGLQGTWRVVGLWVEGRPSAIDATGRTWTFRDSTLATAEDGKVDQQGTVRIDSTSSPARLDFQLRRGTGTIVRRQIYRLADDTLTVAYALENSRESYPRSLDVTKGVVKLKLVRSQ
jgi:uncharacterized protein (TIGR03067 family)